MNITETFNYLNQVNKKGIVLGLDSTRELMHRLGNPQDKIKTIHVAGTNGKGSAVAYISNILMASGYSVGEYISPIIFDYTDKIQLNGTNISKDEVATYITRIRKVCEKMVCDGLPHPTLFEIETAMAFLYFYEKNVDFAVIEVGMGGETDSTNVIKNPVLSIIMSISLDHVGILGNTLAEIAKTKAGIIKENCDCILYQQNDEVMDVVKKACVNKNSKLTISDFSSITMNTSSIEGQCFSYKELENIQIKLLGAHQTKNAVVAIEAAMRLIDMGYGITIDNILSGLANTRWPARFEVISSEPLIIIDGAHNPDAADVFADTVREYLSDYEITYIMGVLADKDYPAVIEKTISLAKNVVTITPNNPRALDATTLATTISSIAKNNDMGKISVCASASLEAGLKSAISFYEKSTSKKRAIIAYGSLSYLGELERIIKTFY